MGTGSYQVCPQLHTLQHTAAHCCTLSLTQLDWHWLISGMYTNTHTATHCNTLQHTATHCNTLSLTQQDWHWLVPLMYSNTHTVSLTMHDTFRWKCYTPEIFQIENFKYTHCLSHYTWQFPLKMPHPRDLPNREIQISQYKFKLYQHLILNLYWKIAYSRHVVSALVHLAHESYRHVGRECVHWPHSEKDRVCICVHDS